MCACRGTCLGFISEHAYWGIGIKVLMSRVRTLMSFCEAYSDELRAQSLGFSVLTKQHACSFQGSLHFVTQGTFRIIIICLYCSQLTVQAPWKLGANHFLSITFGPRTWVSTQQRIIKSVGKWIVTSLNYIQFHFTCKVLMKQNLLYSNLSIRY